MLLINPESKWKFYKLWEELLTYIFAIFSLYIFAIFSLKSQKNKMGLEVKQVHIGYQITIFIWSTSILNATIHTDISFSIHMKPSSFQY